MGKKINDKFLCAFLELDKLCCTKFGVETGGVTEYINRLNNARFAPSRDDVLPRLVRYRNIRNSFAHRPGAIRKSAGITNSDIKWISHFKRDIFLKRDPISKFLKKARRYTLGKKFKNVLIVLLCILGTLLVAGLVNLIKNLVG